MKLCVSNLGWSPAENESVYEHLVALGVRGVEVAPSKIWPEWRGATPSAARAKASELESRGLAVPALQAILYGLSTPQVFGPPEAQRALVDHVAKVAELAAAFGAKTVVFGSHKNRDRGDLLQDEAERRGGDVFRRLAEACAPCGVCLCIEPVPEAYGCTFLTSYRDVLGMVDRVNHPNLGVHLDVAGTELEGDSIVDAIGAAAGRIRHLHVTEPHLGDFASPRMPHGDAAKALRQARYENWASVEMLRADAPVEAIERAVRFVREHYSVH